MAQASLFETIDTHAIKSDYNVPSLFNFRGICWMSSNIYERKFTLIACFVWIGDYRYDYRSELKNKKRDSLYCLNYNKIVDVNVFNVHHYGEMSNAR